MFIADCHLICMVTDYHPSCVVADCHLICVVVIHLTLIHNA